MTTPEAALKTKLREYLTARGAFWSTVQGGAFAKPGDPDIVVCYKGRYVAVEAKAPKGRQSSIQRIRQKQIEDAGGIYVLARTIEDVSEVLDRLDGEIG